MPSEPVGRVAKAVRAGLTRLVQLDFPFLRRQPTREKCEVLLVGERVVRLLYVRNRRARRYILRIEDEDTLRVTLPPRGSYREARDFAERQQAWILHQLQRVESRLREPGRWVDGTEILFRGERSRLRTVVAGGRTEVAFADQTVSVDGLEPDPRPVIEHHLRRLAVRELPARVRALADEHRLAVKRVTVRNQSTRWGSCSTSGAISLNWRLVQLPDYVRDYIILHELMHLRELNHSRRFWTLVAEVCPRYREAERWLKCEWPRPR